MTNYLTRLRSITDEWRTPREGYKAMPAEVIECLISVAKAADGLIDDGLDINAVLSDALADLKKKVEALT